MPESLLRHKQFYFLTDRESQVTFLINNKDQRRYVYYPIEYETMSSTQIRRYKWNIVAQMLWYSLFDKTKMTEQDRSTCRSKIIDIAGVIALSLCLARYTRKFLFKVEIKYLERNLAHSAFTPKWVKSVFSYLIPYFILFQTDFANIQLPYLIDLAYEYQYLIQKDNMLSSEINELYLSLSNNRFD